MARDRLVTAVLLLLLLLGASVMTDGRHDNRLATSTNVDRRKSGDIKEHIKELYTFIDTIGPRSMSPWQILFNRLEFKS